MKRIFRPKILDTFSNYTWAKFGSDAMAGLIIGIVALPLAIAFAIASGVSPEKGLITAIIAGFLISALGGSRVQIGGPTGAFIIIVYGIVQQYGVEGLIAATFIAGVMMILMGLAQLGSVIKFIPHSLIIGFTSGIAVIIFSSQIKDFFGLEMGDVPADFIDKWGAFIEHFHTINLYSLAIGVATIAIVFISPYFSKKIPGSLFAIILATIIVQVFDLPVETIGSRFGSISSSIPAPSMPGVNFQVVKDMIQPAFAIAMLGAIESLLSAVVADGMIGGRHRSNTELIGQGIANIGSSLFGGIPATGAIARTATNVKNGGRTPVAGIIHAITLFFILIFLGKWASYIPLSCLAGILVVISINMSEYKNFLRIIKGPKGDVAVMLTTFLLTVLIDLTIAIEVGIVLAAFTFIRKMIKTSDVRLINRKDDEEFVDDWTNEKLNLPTGIKIVEISGPLFFGAAYKLRDALRYLDEDPQVLIVRMRKVPIIDASGISSFRDFLNELADKKVTVVLSELGSDQVKKEMKKSGILDYIGENNIQPDLVDALIHGEEILRQIE